MKTKLITSSSIVICLAVSGIAIADNSVVVSASVSKVSASSTQDEKVKGSPATVAERSINENYSSAAVVPTANVEVYSFAQPGASPVNVTEENEVAATALKAATTMPSIYIDGPYRHYRDSGRVDFDLTKGLLKPQVIQLLLQHPLIDAADDIQWKASDNFMWPNSHTLSGDSLDHVINAVLKPYKLLAEFKGNGSVIIKKL